MISNQKMREIKIELAAKLFPYILDEKINNSNFHISIAEEAAKEAYDFAFKFIANEYRNGEMR